MIACGALSWSARARDPFWLRVALRDIIDYGSVELRFGECGGGDIGMTETLPEELVGGQHVLDVDVAALLA